MLLDIQRELKAPKGQFNSFGNYKFRSCEDILEAVKPLLAKYGCTLVLSDDVVCILDRVYIKATATFTDENNKTTVATAFARESESKKGMDDSQITGTASSYARKYALNGLFLIDDTKDADTDEYKKTTDDLPKKPTKATKKQIEIIKSLISDIPALLEYYKIDKLEELSVKQASEIIEKKKGK